MQSKGATRDTAERARERSCFYCANTHNFTEEKCECVCHKVAPTWDALEAIEKDLGWTIPQLIAIQKLQAKARRDGILDAEAAFKEAYSEYEEPLIGVMYGMKAIAALAQALQPAMTQGLCECGQPENSIRHSFAAASSVDAHEFKLSTEGQLRYCGTCNQRRYFVNGKCEMCQQALQLEEKEGADVRTDVSIKE